MLHPANHAIVAATADVVAANAVNITKVFYPKMFGNNPELLNVFNEANQAIGEQPVALASSIVAYARHLLGAGDVPFDRVIDRIAHKHVALGIAPHQYTIVGRNLMEAIGEVLGDAVTPEIAAAWGEVYWLFAMDLVAAEAKIYGGLGVTPDTLLRDHTLIAKTETAPGVFTLRFAPVGEESVHPFAAGQYLSVVADLGNGRRQPRQYTLSNSHRSDWLEITVKRVAGQGGAPDGVVSNLLCDAQLGSVWPLSAPCGDVHMNLTDTKPLVLVSAGVGITPMAAILACLAEDVSQRSVTHVHFDSDAAAMPLAQQTADAVEKLANGRQELVFGATEVTALDALEVTADTDVFLCGSVPFMRSAREVFIKKGLPSDHIYYEVFGPDLWLGGSVASRAS